MISLISHWMKQHGALCHSVKRCRWYMGQSTPCLFFLHYHVIDLKPWSKKCRHPFYSSKAMVCPSEGICRESGMGICQGEQHWPCDCPPIVRDRAQFIPWIMCYRFRCPRLIPRYSFMFLVASPFSSVFSCVKLNTKGILSYSTRLKWVLTKWPFSGDTARFSSYGRMGYVHIDDVASSHILVYEAPEATGRYLCSSVVLDNDELVSLLAKRYPIFPIPRRLVVWIRAIDSHETTAKSLTEML